MKKHLVLVHGYLGGSAQWAQQVTLLSQHFNLVTVDLPGFGLNQTMESPQSIRGYAEYVFGQLDQLGIEYFHLLGHSMGGMIVQEMVAIAPSRIDHLILYGTGPVGMLPNRFETIQESKRRVRVDGAKATGCRIAATWFIKGEQAAQYNVCAELAEKASLQASLAGLNAMEPWSGESYMKQIQSPTLVIWGDGDRTYQWSQPEQLWRNIAAAQLAVMPGCAHAAHLEKPHLFNQLLMDFLNFGPNPKFNHDHD